MFLLPTLWPPHNPTHRLVYVSTSPVTPTSAHSNPPPNLPSPITPTFPHALAYPQSAPPGPRRSTLPTHLPSTTTTSSHHGTPLRHRRSPLAPIDRSTKSQISSRCPPFHGLPQSHAYLETLTQRLVVHPDRPRLLPYFRPRDSLTTSRKYEMSMRQQPVQARMCNAGEKGDLHFGLGSEYWLIWIADRRPIDPPPIIQLKVIDTEAEDMGIERKKGKKGRRGSIARMNYMHSKSISSLCEA